MEDGTEKIIGQNYPEKNEFLSKVVRAGKRTYFFDLKTTRRNDFYLTITESKKRMDQDGNPFYEKHKIFLYSEDFESFNEGLQQMMEYIQTVQPELKSYEDGSSAPIFIKHNKNAVVETEPELEEAVLEGYTNIDYDNLEKR
jgi:hypothetical protein